MKAGSRAAGTNCEARLRELRKPSTSNLPIHAT